MCFIFFNSWVDLARITGEVGERDLDVPGLLLDSPRLYLVFLYQQYNISVIVGLAERCALL